MENQKKFIKNRKNKNLNKERKGERLVIENTSHLKVFFLKTKSLEM